MNMATLNISSHQIFLFPPSLTLQQGQEGKWKPIRASETAKISHRSKPMDQMTYPQSRHPSLIPDVPPIEEKRVMRCRLLELRHRALDDHSMLLRVKFISKVQGRRDKKRTMMIFPNPVTETMVTEEMTVTTEKIVGIMTTMKKTIVETALVEVVIIVAESRWRGRVPALDCQATLDER